MSKNISIAEGGVAKQLTVDKLKTNMYGGGSCIWVPEDVVNLGSKTIKQSGVYKASDDGYYGYDKVVVEGAGIAVGLDPNNSGEYVAAQTDPVTGKLTLSYLPYKINITTPPSKLDYNDGENIQYNGIVVKAYLKSGEIWQGTGYANGVVPAQELIFPVIKADIEKSYLKSEIEDTSVLHYPTLNTVSYTSGATASETIYVEDPPGGKNTQQWHETRYTVQSDGSIYKFALIDQSGYIGTAFVSKRDIRGTIEQAIWRKNVITGEYTEVWVGRGDMIRSSCLYDGGRIVYAVEGYFDHKEDGKSVDAPINIIPDGATRYYTECDYGYILLYGTPMSSQAKQDVPVQWNRPVDGTLLEAMFQISVSGQIDNENSNE